MLRHQTVDQLLQVFRLFHVNFAGGMPLRKSYQEAVREVAPGIRCPTGEARLTPGFDLAARHVIHTVGPRYRDAERSAPLLVAAYRSALELAGEHGLSTIAFPAISCGIYGYPLEEAAPLAIETCRAHAGSLTEIRFALFGADTYRAWQEAAARLLA